MSKKEEENFSENFTEQDLEEIRKMKASICENSLVSFEFESDGNDFDLFSKAKTKKQKTKKVTVR